MIFERKFFTTIDFLQPDRKISYMECNTAGVKPSNVVFCVPGLLCNAMDFEYLADYISKDYRVISVDLPGRGQSDYLEDYFRYCLPTYVSDLACLIDSLELSNIIWTGSSLGGILGFMLNSVKPGLIRKFVINDVGPFISHDSMLILYNALKSMADFKHDGYSKDEMHNILKMMFVQWNITEEKDWEHIFKNYAIKSDKGYRFNFDKGIIDAELAYQKLSDNMRFDLSGIWQLITAPILQLFGQKSQIVTDEVLDYMMNAKENIFFVKSVGSGHILNLMNGDQLHIIKKWLDLTTALSSKEIYTVK